MSLNNATFSSMAPMCHLLVMCASAEMMGMCSCTKVPFVVSGSVYHVDLNACIACLSILCAILQLECVDQCLCWWH